MSHREEHDVERNRDFKMKWSRHDQHGDLPTHRIRTLRNLISEICVLKVPLLIVLMVTHRGQALLDAKLV